jgi:alpha-L-arabinofuranosidase
VGNPNDNYYNFQSTPHVMEERTELVEGLIDIAMEDAEREDEIKIAWDEYNVWYRARSGSDMEGETALEERYNLSDALVIAGFLNGFIRQADIVKMANLAQLVNVIGTMFTTPDDMFKQTIYYPLQLYSEHAYGTSLDVHVNSETYDTDEFVIGLGEQRTQQSDMPYLDVSATYQDDGEVIINVVNRNKDEAITTDLLAQTGAFEGPFEVYEINGPDVKARNNFEEQPVQTEQLDDVQASGNAFTEDEWFSAMYQARRFDDIITRYSTIMDRYDPEKRVGLSIDEWGMWHKVEPGTNPGFLYQQNALRDALVAAVSLNIFNQHADRVEIANIAQTINVLQAMILTKGDDMILTPTYHVFDMYQVHHDAALLPTTTIEDGSYEHGGRSIPAISSSASRDEEGRMHVTIANMDPNRARKVQLKFRGAAVAGVSTGRVLTADAMQAHNTFDEPEAVKPEPFDGTEVSGNTLSVQMPSKSVVVLELE